MWRRYMERRIVYRAAYGSGPFARNFRRAFWLTLLGMLIWAYWHA